MAAYDRIADVPQREVDLSSVETPALLDMVILLSVAATLTLLLGLVLLLLRGICRLWRKPGGGRAAYRSTIVTSCLLLIGIPYYLAERSDRKFLLARIPAPLEVEEVEYRLEKSWGIGLPGDNETGFVVYRLTRESAEWALSMGDRLRDKLPGSSSTWYPTPVKDAGDRKWHPYDHDPEMTSVQRPTNHPPTIQEYIGKYGFYISIESGRDVEADTAIKSEGSIYSYGRGSSVTIVDPKRGKVYFAYAG